MTTVLKNSWALLLGMLLLMLGNGLQSTLLGVRGAIEGFTPSTMSWVMAGYFVGFLGGSQMAPEMIRRVGHVRVFAALASLISACLILFAAYPNEFFWFFLRVVIGFCFSGVYVVAESWLNDAATNETRGQTLSTYLIVQMMGIVLAQLVLNFADPSGFMLFIIVSVVVSLSFAPILLSVSPAPMFTTTSRMSFKKLFNVSPLGVVGNFLLGGVFAALFGMAPVFGTEKGFSVSSISIFVSAIYLGGMLLQFPIGWLSDRMDRRRLIAVVAVIALAASSVGLLFSNNYQILLITAFIIGGMANPLYSLYIAYTNDFLEHSDMAAASGGLVFISGLGAIFGPLVLGWAMTNFGADSFFVFIGLLFALMAIYALYRMTQRAAPNVDDTGMYNPIVLGSSPVAVEFAQEYAIDMAIEEEERTEAIQGVLDFWVKEVGEQKWYVADDDLDETIKARFHDFYLKAADEDLVDWEDTPEGALASIILIDQFARNMFRGSYKSFEADAVARDIADRAIEQDFDLEIEGPLRQFFYMPYMHSERLADQDRGVEMFNTRMEGGDNLLHAKVHRKIIQDFGRFPYRNEALGRKTTKKEKAFLEEGGYSALVKKFQNPDNSS